MLNMYISRNMCPQFDQEIAAETLKLQQIQQKYSMYTAPQKYVPPTAEEQREIDSRSVHMSNVDWNSTVEEIEKFFYGCGEIKRVTIPKDKFTGRQKNFAFIEFDSPKSASMALLMDKSEFRNRFVTVVAKRTNKPGMNASKVGGPRYGKNQVVVKYVYVNAPAPGRYSKRFTPY
uniref:RRM domain-containing protein n=3 Tax=Caenorhabditis japonica TaxID=281687 RepID=A0A8R1IDK0_CAEJA